MNARPYVYIALLLGVAGILVIPALWGYGKKDTLAPSRDSGPVDATPVVDASAEGEIARLEAELDEARRLAAELQVRLDGIENERINETILAWLAELRATADQQIPDSEVERQKLFETYFRRVEHHNFSTGMFGGFDDGLFLLAGLGRMGEAGEQLLLDSIHDRTKDDAFRTQALEVLTYLSGPIALETFLNPPPDLVERDAFHPENELKRIAQMTALLSATDVAPHEARISALMQNGVAQNDSDAYKLATVMAFQHDDAYAYQVLRQPAAINEHIQEVLRIAAWTGTPEARRFVEEMQQVHHDPEVRAAALKLLEEW